MLTEPLPGCGPGLLGEGAGCQALPGILNGSPSQSGPRCASYQARPPGHTVLGKVHGPSSVQLVKHPCPPPQHPLGRAWTRIPLSGCSDEPVGTDRSRWRSRSWWWTRQGPTALLFPPPAPQMLPASGQPVPSGGWAPTVCRAECSKCGNHLSCCYPSSLPLNSGKSIPVLTHSL